MPIFVFENDFMWVFPVQRDAEVDLECYDVLDGAYVAFDAQGRKLRLDCAEESAPLFMSLAEEEPTHAEDLRRRILLHLEEYSKIPAPEDTSLAALVDHCLAFKISVTTFKRPDGPLRRRLFRWFLSLFGVSPRSKEE
ncbi:hypothetical protein M7784_09950 [Desulfovibrio aminophilus]|nr:hypothetical protein [Desulfovibrio aminophilus]MCM0755566.1 hypothetical protein [Desulfovibrio aminophilus]